MNDTNKEILRTHWGVIKQTYPADKKVTIKNGYETISSEYMDWMNLVYKQLFEMIEEIEFKGS